MGAQNFSPRRPPPITKPEEDRSFPRAIYLRTMRATKFVTLAFAGALLALSLVSKATAQDAPPGSLLITAEGRALAPYDMIYLDIEVKVMNDIERATSAPLAQSEHSQASEALLKTLNEDLGFPYKNVSTGSMNLSPITNWTDGVSKIIGYQSTSTSTLEVNRDFDVAAILEEVSKQSDTADNEDGVTVTVSVNSFQPYVSEEAEQMFEEKLFDDAMDKATRKAVMYAKGAQRQLGPIMRMSDKPLEGESDPSPPPYPEPRTVMAAPDLEMGKGTPTIPLGRGEDLSTTIYLEYQLL